MNYAKIFISLFVALIVAISCSTLAEKAWVIQDSELNLIKHLGVVLAATSTFLLTKSKLNSKL